MAEKENIPAVVLELAKTVEGNLISWRINPDNVVIVFEDGRKLVFEKDVEIAEAKQTPAPKSVQKKKEK